MTDATTMARYEAAVRKALRYYPPDISPEQLQILKADLRLQFDHPGCYVAYLDVWMDGDDGPILDRQVLAVDRSYPVVWEQTKDHPQVGRIAYDYCDDPDGALEPILEDLD